MSTSNTSSKLFIVLIVVAIIIAIIVGFIAYTHQQNKSNDTNHNNTFHDPTVPQCPENKKLNTNKCLCE
jgi:cell division protein FtsN